MVQVDLPAAFTIGQLFAFLSRDHLRQEKRLFTNRLLGPLNVFLSCCYAPVGMFLLVAWPAWEVMYRTAWVEDPFNRPWVAAFYVLFGIAMVLLGNLGFILAHHWLRRGKPRRVIVAMVVGALLTVLPFVLRWGVWWHVGTHAQIQAGQGYSFWKAPFFSGWAVIMAYMVVGGVATGVWFKTRGNRLDL